ncbi:MAG TPA: hypothetical protein VGW12_08675 [Pyrinomonadaceae bacterium]|nr:hypothetical protein [Pyrinomonadaceae bacterium]
MSVIALAASGRVCEVAGLPEAVPVVACTNSVGEAAREKRGGRGRLGRASCCWRLTE